MPRRILTAALAALLSTAAGAQEGAGSSREYRQSPAVLARYADVPIELKTPAFAPGRDGFTSQAEMEAFLRALKARAPRMHLASLGRSQQGRDLPLVVLTAEGLSDLGAVRALGRPVVWLIGQQHGNEPAGGEAMLALAGALAEGELTSLLERITVVVVPRANPDGAAADRRTAANGLDLNRDHLLLTLPEVRALHAKTAELPPDVVVDAHEFQVAGTWLAKFGALQAPDAMLLSATNPAVPRPLVDLAESFYLPAIEDALKGLGLTSFWYHTATGRADDRSVAMGGNAPGISRNLFGLSGAVSFLVETRGIGVGRQAYQRRVATHYAAARAVLERTAAEPERILRTAAAARAALSGSAAPLVVGHRIGSVRLAIPLIDPATGDERPTEVEFRDSRRSTVTVTRPPPAGYLARPEAEAAVEALRIKGARLCPVPPGEAEAEAFLVASRPGPANRESINPEQSLSVTLATRRVTLPAGTVYVPFGQPLAAVIAASLEPDSPGSFVGVGLTLVLPTGEAPVYRVPAGAPPVAAPDCRP